MEQEVRLNDLHEMLTSLEYPLSKDEARDELEGVTLRYADGEEPLAAVIGRTSDGVFEDEDELESEIYSNVDIEAVGEPGQSEGDA